MIELSKILFLVFQLFIIYRLYQVGKEHGEFR